MDGGPIRPTSDADQEMILSRVNVASAFHLVEDAALSALDLYSELLGSKSFLMALLRAFQTFTSSCPTS